MRASVILGVAALLLAAPAPASVITLGSTYAESCYNAADSRRTDAEAWRSCNSALTWEALTLEDRVGTHVNRGILFMISGDLLSAVRDYDAALALNPHQPEAWLNKAIAVYQANDFARAAEFAGRALELGTLKPALAYFVRGIAREDMGEVKAAYADLIRARELEPKWRDPQVELARYQVRQR